MQYLGFANFKPKVRYRKYRKGDTRAGVYYLRHGDTLYIGESTDIERRVQEHIDDIVEGCHRMSQLDDWGILLRMPKSTWRERLVTEKRFCTLLQDICHLVSKPHVCA